MDPWIVKSWNHQNQDILLRYSILDRGALTTKVCGRNRSLLFSLSGRVWYRQIIFGIDFPLDFQDFHDFQGFPMKILESVDFDIKISGFRGDKFLSTFFQQCVYGSSSLFQSLVKNETVNFFVFAILDIWFSDFPWFWSWKSWSMDPWMTKSWNHQNQDIHR